MRMNFLKEFATYSTETFVSPVTNVAFRVATYPIETFATPITNVAFERIIPSPLNPFAELYENPSPEMLARRFTGASYYFVKQTLLEKIQKLNSEQFCLFLDQALLLGVSTKKLSQFREENVDPLDGQTFNIIYQEHQENQGFPTQPLHSLWRLISRILDLLIRMVGFSSILEPSSATLESEYGGEYRFTILWDIIKSLFIWATNFTGSRYLGAPGGVAAILGVFAVMRFYRTSLRPLDEMPPARIPSREPKPNEAALDLQIIERLKSVAPKSPCLLTGNSGAGKSYHLNALAHHLKRERGIEVIYFDTSKLLRPIETAKQASLDDNLSQLRQMKKKIVLILDEYQAAFVDDNPSFRHSLLSLCDEFAVIFVTTTAQQEDIQRNPQYRKDFAPLGRRLGMREGTKVGSRHIELEDMKIERVKLLLRSSLKKMPFTEENIDDIIRRAREVHLTMAEPARSLDLKKGIKNWLKRPPDIDLQLLTLRTEKETILSELRAGILTKDKEQTHATDLKNLSSRINTLEADHKRHVDDKKRWHSLLNLRYQLLKERAHLSDDARAFRRDRLLPALEGIITTLSQTVFEHQTDSMLPPMDEILNTVYPLVNPAPSAG